MKDFIIKHWLTVLFGVVVSFITGLITKARTERKRNQLNSDAIKAMLLYLILQAHETYNRRGYITAQELHIVEGLNTNYKELGGNGTARALMVSLEDLPSMPKT